MNEYLIDVPQEIEKYGFCKVLFVRYEIIHIKHIFTEIFVRKSIDIEKYLNKVGWCLFDYIEYMTNKVRKIHYFSRDCSKDLNKIVKSDRDDFFPTIQLYNDFDNIIILDFDGVVNKISFHELYELCVSRCKTIICSANPQITEDYFIKNKLPIPDKIYSRKGKIQKIKCILELNKKYDNVFYIDNEEEYLRFAWIFGFKTFIYKNNKIKYFTLKTK